MLDCWRCLGRRDLYAQPRRDHPCLRHHPLDRGNGYTEYDHYYQCRRDFHTSFCWAVYLARKEVPGLDCHKVLVSCWEEDWIEENLKVIVRCWGHGRWWPTKAMTTQMILCWKLELLNSLVSSSISKIGCRMFWSYEVMSTMVVARTGKEKCSPNPMST